MITLLAIDNLVSRTALEQPCQSPLCLVVKFLDRNLKNFQNANSVLACEQASTDSKSFGKTRLTINKVRITIFSSSLVLQSYLGIFSVITHNLARHV